MRYKCERCDGFIKDKFIFGLVHLCITEEEYRNKLIVKQMMENQKIYSDMGLNPIRWLDGNINNG